MSTEKPSDIGVLTGMRTLILVGLGFTVSLFFWLISVLIRIVSTGLRTLVFLVVTMLYGISLPVPFLGQKLLDVNRNLRIFDITNNNLLESFRSDMMDIMVEQHRPDYTNERNRLRSEIELEYLKAKKKHEIGELIISIWGSVLAIILSYYQLWPKLSLVVSIYIVMMTVSILVRIVVLELLAFDSTNAENELNLPRLELMLGWNRAILNSISSQLMILLLGVLGLIHTSGYEVAKDILERYYVDEYSKRELLQYLLNSIFN